MQIANGGRCPRSCLQYSMRSMSTIKMQTIHGIGAKTDVPELGRPKVSYPVSNATRSTSSTAFNLIWTLVACAPFESYGYTLKMWKPASVSKGTLLVVPQSTFEYT